MRTLTNPVHAGQPGAVFSVVLTCALVLACAAAFVLKTPRRAESAMAAAALPGLTSAVLLIVHLSSERFVDPGRLRSGVVTRTGI